MRFDPRHWNLLAGAAFTALAGCGIPAADDPGTDGDTPECQNDADCPGGDRCSPAGFCYDYDDPCGDPQSLERCSPPDEGGDDEDDDGDCDPSYCPFEGDCDDGLPSCGLVPDIPPCVPELEVTEIPIDVLPPGILHFAQADGDPGLEPLLIERDNVWLLSADDAVPLPRAEAENSPAWVEHADLDSDGVDELLIADATGTTVVFSLNGQPERTEELHGPIVVVDLEGTGEPYVGSHHEGSLSIFHWDDGERFLDWEFEATRLLGRYSPTAEGPESLGSSGVVFNTYTEVSSRLVGNQLEFEILVAEPLPSSTSAGIKLTRDGLYDLVIQTSNGGTTKIRTFGEGYTTTRGMVPGSYTRSLTATVVGGYPTIISLGEDNSLATLVDGANLLCHSPLPYFHSAVGGDFDHDGTTELLVQYPSGAVSTLDFE